MVRALEHASGDSRVKGLLTVVGSRDRLGGLASVQEMRDAIRTFGANRAVPTVAWAAAFGEAGNSGTIPLYLATACNQVGGSDELRTSTNEIFY